MLRVCHVSSVHKSDDARIFYKQCSSLAAAGYDTYLIIQGVSRTENGVQVLGFGDAPKNRLMRMLITTRIIYKKALSINADIYQLHDPELIGFGLKLKKHGKIVIFDSHEDYVELMKEKPWIPKLFRPIVSKIYAWYQNKVLKQYNALIAASPTYADKLKGVNSKIEIITNYPIITEKINIPPRQREALICFAGLITQSYMHHKIIEALTLCQGVRYVLCGSVHDEGYLRELQSMDNWTHVDFRGRIPHSEVRGLLAECAIGMAVSDYIGNFGGKMGSASVIKLFEYMAAGLPVICTDFVLWKEIIDKHNCGISVNPHDTKAIAEAINYLIENPDAADEMGKNGRRAVLEEYNWISQEKKLVGLYKSLEQT